MATLDNLDIKISVSTQEALKGIREVTNALKELTSTAKGIDLGKVATVTKALPSRQKADLNGEGSPFSMASTEEASKNIETSIQEAVSEGTNKGLLDSVSQAKMGEGITSAFSDVTKSAEGIEDIKEKFSLDDVLSKIQDSVGNVCEEFNKAKGSTDKFLKSFAGLSGIDLSVLRAMKSVLQAIFNWMVKIVKESMKLTNKLAKLGLEKLANGAKSLLKTLTGFNKIQSIGKSLSGLFSMLKRQIERMAIRSLIRSVTQGIGEAWQNLAENDARTAASVKSLTNAMGQLRSSIATIAAPIVNALAPALIQIINLATKAANALARLAALLTGQKTYTVASGFKDVESAAGGAAGAVKDAEKTILGFDEINKLNSASGSGGGGGGGGAGGGGIFEEVGIGDWEFDSWGEALETFLRWMSTTGIPKLRTKLIEAAGAFNDFNQNVYDALTFGDVQKLIGNLGTQLGDALNDVIDTFDWKTAGRALGMVWESIFNFAGSLFTTFDFTTLGQDIATFFNNVFASITPESLGDTLGGLASGIINAIGGFLANFDAGTFLDKASIAIQKMADQIGTAIDNHEWLDTTKKICQSIANFLTETPWGDYIAKIATWVSDFVRTVTSEFVAFIRSSEGQELIGQIVDAYIEVTAAIAEARGAAEATVSSAVARKFVQNIVGVDAERGNEAAWDNFFRGQQANVNTWQNIFQSGVDGNEEIWSNFYSDQIDDAEDFGRDVGASYTALNNKARSNFSAIQQSVTSSTKAAKTQGISNFSNLNSKSQSYLRELNTKGSGSGNTLRDNLVTASSDARTRMNEQFAKVPDEASKNISDIKGKVDLAPFETTGKNITQGIIKGMGMDYAPALAQWTRQFTDNVNKGFKIHSPSKLFRDETGVWLTLGIVEGMEEEIPSVKKVCDAITQTAQNSVDGMQLSIPTPTMAGSVGSMDYQSKSNNQITSMLNAILKTVQSGQDKQQPIELTVQMDGKTISRVVTNYQTNASRRYKAVTV